MLNLKRLAFGLFAIVGCGGNSVVHIQGSGDAGTSDDAGEGDGGTQDRDGSAAGSDASTANPDDGVASHMACVQADGTGITGSYGRLDGYLRAVILPNTGCGADSDHVHLRVEANGKIYDFAVNIYSSRAPASDVFFLAKDAPLPSGAWSEGWRSSGVTLDYPSNLKVASGDFTQTPRAQLASTIDAGSRLQIMSASLRPPIPPEPVATRCTGRAAAGTAQSSSIRRRRLRASCCFTSSRRRSESR